MKTLSLAALLLSGGCVLSANTAVAGSYLTMNAGDSAVFAGMGRFVDSSSEVAVTEVRGSQRLYSDFAGLGPVWVSSPANSEVVELQLVNTNQRIRFDLSAPVGRSFNINLDECAKTAKIASKTDTLTTDAGTFKNVVTVNFSGRCADGGLGHISFAPGVGIVEYSHGNIAGPVIHRLAAAHIGDKHYPTLGLSVNADVPTARIFVANGISYASAVFTVKNNGEQPLPLTFNGKDHDIVLLDNNGVEINRYSNGRLYTMGIINTTLAAGGQYRYFARMPLVNSAGVNLDVGSYQMRLEFHGNIRPFNGAEPVVNQRPVSVSVPVFVDGRMTIMPGVGL